MQLSELFDQWNIAYRRAGEHHHASLGWINSDCPVCSPNSHHFRLGWHLLHGHTNCWSCGKVDRLEALLGLTGRSRLECLEALKSLTGGIPLVVAKPTGKLQLPTGLGALQRIHKSYLYMRRFDPDELVQMWNIQGIGIHASLSWRIFIPITYHGQVVSWTTRAVSDATKYRYITAKAEEESMPAKELLFGEEYTRHAAIVVEGPFDVFRIGPGAVAVMGLSYTRSQLLKISKYPLRVICFDSEPAARVRAGQLCQALEVFPGRTVHVELQSADPGSASRKEVQLLRKSFLE